VPCRYHLLRCAFAVAFAVLDCQPLAHQACQILDRASHQAVPVPARHLPCLPRRGMPRSWPPADHNDFHAWCSRHGVKPRFGAVGRYGSIAVLERFMRTLKAEGLRRILVPLGLPEMRLETSAFVRWYNEHRPHSSLDGATPREVYEERRPANRRPRFEPRARYPGDGSCAAPRVGARVRPGAELRVVVSRFEGAEHLPVVDIKRAA